MKLNESLLEGDNVAKDVKELIVKIAKRQAKIAANWEPLKAETKMKILQWDRKKRIESGKKINF